MLSLQTRMFLLLTALFAIIYAVIVMIGTAMGVGNFYFYLFISVLMMVGQYLIGPKIVEWSMRVKYVTRAEYPILYSMLEEMTQRANMPMPKIGVSPEALPNAFAFGRSKKDGRVCVTEGILRLLNPEELRAVLGHELSHIKNQDVLTITLLSVIPMIMYRIAWHFMFYRGGSRDRGGNTALIGIAAFFFYFITNLLVLYASRIREYYADAGSLELGNKPSSMASALYKLVYGSARMNRDVIKESEGLKAFFVNDPSRAFNEIKELRQLDLDRSGTIDSSELLSLRGKMIRLSFADKMMEMLSTHPNMLKRIQHLSTRVA
jgi:heat shock protein HtpX